MKGNKWLGKLRIIGVEQIVTGKVDMKGNKWEACQKDGA
jgi:hypothetical protein